MTKKLLLIPLVLLVVGALLLGACGGGGGGKTLKIGFLLGLTGPGSQMFIEQRDVGQITEDYINKNGGVTVNGQKYTLDVIFEDDKNTPADCVTAVTRLISQEGVKFVIGGPVPDQVAAIASVTEKNKVFYGASSIDVMHPDWPMTFVLKYSWVAPIPGLYDTMLEQYPNAKVMGFLVGDEGGARAIAGVSRQIAQGHGLTLLDNVEHPWETTEFAPTWTKELSLKPDAVDVGIGFPDSTATCIKQGREAGFTGPMLATTSADPTLMLNMIGAQYSYGVIWPAYDVNGPAAPDLAKQVVGLWKESHTSPVTADGLSAWDQINLVVQAIEKANSLDPAVVAKTFETMEDLTTTTGKARMGGGQTFGINHMVFQPAPISMLKDGQVQFVKWFDPYVP
jgi:branched-chain amino acid transport system substrate-binding protein